MGGKALKNCFTRRYEKEEFEKIVPEIREKLMTLFTDAQPTRYYSEKETFGDADFLCLVDKPINVNMKEWLQETFQPKEIFQNSHVYSFEYKELQVDAILTPKSSWESSLTYFSYNDLHNLVGKIAHKFWLKWGYDGLRFVYRIDGKVLGDITLTTDYKVALPFLGFDLARYEQGFKNLSEIFDFVTSSKYFNPWMFDFETLNRINRERDQKRATYSSFVNHVDSYKSLGPGAFHYFYPDKKVYLGHIDHHFPGFLRKYRELEKKEELKQATRERFSGDVVMGWYPELKDKALGTAIKNFYEYFADKESANSWILSLSSDEANDVIRSTFNRVNREHLKSLNIVAH